MDWAIMPNASARAMENAGVFIRFYYFTLIVRGLIIKNILKKEYKHRG